MSDSRLDIPGARLVPAPSASDLRLRSTILDVVCGLNEDIEWHWTLTDRGWFVSGYSIVQQTRNVDALCKAMEVATTTPVRSRKSFDSAPRRRGTRR